MKNEPDWMRDFRLRSLEIFRISRCPNGAATIAIDFQDIYYYLKPTEQPGPHLGRRSAEIKDTFDKLGIPEAERSSFPGVKAQFESEVVYGSLKEDLAEKGVIFTDTDTAVREHPDLLREYFGKIIPPERQQVRRAQLGVWSGGSFIYIPKGVKIEFPLQAYFRINAENMGQFERTLIIVDEGAGSLRRRLHRPDVQHRKPALGGGRSDRQEGRPLPLHDDPELGQQHLQPRHQAGHGLRRRPMEWIDGNLGSRLTMKYPAVYMMEPGARGEILSIAFSAAGQHQDAGAKVVHCAPNTTARSSRNRASARTAAAAAIAASCKVEKGAHGVKSNVVCDALILDEKSRSDTYPYIEVEEQDVQIGHEASVSRIGEEQLFYLMSRGLTEAEASTMIVNGFIEPLVKELPMEYAVEMNRLIECKWKVRYP
jgi:Fe-S cluster assembly protein SufB